MQSTIPLSTPWPRGLSRVQAAAYVGIGVTFFDQQVYLGVMPKPVKIGARVLWDLRELDAAFDSLKQTDQVAGDNPWDSPQ
jgi:predicted DNA-binding transcriptional regulator AlpA